MPHHKSAKKRLVTNKKRNLHNRPTRAKVRTAVKAFRREAADLAPAERNQRLNGLYGLLDAQARKNLMHKKKAARLKSRLAALCQE